MISLELSMVQHNQAESARLSAATDEFLRRGGQITEKAGAIPAPRPYGYSAAAVARKAPAARRSKTEVMRSLRIVPDIEESQAKPVKAEPHNLELVRELAKTKCQADVAAETGISRKRLYSMSLAYGFEFQPSEHGGECNLIHNHSDPIEDARMVERIKAFRDVGLSQRQATKHMDISSTLFRRLIRDYAIDYPLRGPCNVKAKAS